MNNRTFKTTVILHGIETIAQFEAELMADNVSFELAFPVGDECEPVMIAQRKKVPEVPL